jgi:hypothetical protein
VYVFDVTEAEFFLSTGQLPVGRVIAAIPEHDCAEVEVIGLTETEIVRVSNLHLKKIDEEEFSERANRILDARDEAVRQIDSALHERQPVVVWKKLMNLCNERCQVSSVDCTTYLEMRAVDPKTKKQIVCSVPWASLSKLISLELPEEVRRRASVSKSSARRKGSSPAEGVSPRQPPGMQIPPQKNTAFVALASRVPPPPPRPPASAAAEHCFRCARFARPQANRETFARRCTGATWRRTRSAT